MCFEIVGIYKKCCVKFQSIQDSFLLLTIYKMVDSKYLLDIYKSVKISVVTVMKNPEMLKCGPDHLQTKQCLSMQLKNCLIF